MPAAAATAPHAAIMWFRKGLRLHDNQALLHAAKHRHLYPIFILDPFFLEPARVGTNRMNFLLQSLQDLDNSLRARGSRLLVLRGKPLEVLPQLFEEWQVSTLCFEHDTEPYAVLRDTQVKSLACEAGVQVFSPVSHTLYDTKELLKGQNPPLTYKGFQKLVDAAGPPAAPAPDPPARLPSPSAVASATANKFAVPSLAGIGYQDQPSTSFKGGETVALSMLGESLSDSNWVAAFEKPKGDPAAFIKPATTQLSPYLKFGCLSARLFHAKLLQTLAKHKTYTHPPVSLRGQLLWREFFYTVGATTPNFQHMEGNPICKQIPWDTDDAAKARYQAWEEASTGYPWIDAIMMQLRTVGWMHHLARHSVACFLTRGDLFCPWMWGAATFDRLLIDGDWSINNGNWMWLAASSFFYSYFRVYSPVTFGKKYDPEGAFVKHFLPVLKDFPAKYVYEPWTAPLEVQQKAKCIIGKDYPRPIVDHAEIVKENMERMKAAYAADSGKPSTSQPATARRTAASGSKAQPKRKR